MPGMNKPALLAVLCCLLVSCAEFPFLQQPASTETETGTTTDTTEPEVTEPVAENQPTQSASETERAQVQTVPVGSRETIVKTPDSEVSEAQEETESPAEQASDPSADGLEQDPTSDEPEAQTAPEVDSAKLIEELCGQIGNKLTSVSVRECNDQDLIHAAFSHDGRSLAYRDYLPLPSRDSLGRVLVIGGIHGDEFSSVSVVFKWMNILNQFHSGLFHWRFIPAANPDGLLIADSQRQNTKGIDLNRNFPTADWNDLAEEYWIERTYRNPRRYPGESAMSEPEIQFLVEQIREFDPDIIISMHAPYHLVDYDGPPSAPNKVGGLYLRELGVYPGSLGNYFGVDKAKPIVTIELKSAGIMPTDREIDRMWTDLVRWLREQLPES